MGIGYEVLNQMNQTSIANAKNALTSSKAILDANISAQQDA
jgi:hypothetical protein